MNEFLLMSGWLFWVVILLFVIAEIAAAENEHLGFGVAIFVLTAFLIIGLSDADPIGAIVRNPIVAIAAVPAYFAAGTVWSFWKWRGVIGDSVLEYEARKATLLKEYESRPHKDKTFEQYIRLFYDFPPSASKNKERITTWIALWPFSLLWATLTYPRKVALAIYRRVVTAFQRMADSAFAGKFIP